MATQVEIDQPKVDENDRIIIDFTVHQPDEQLVVEVPKDFPVNSRLSLPNSQMGVTTVQGKCGISLLHATYLVYLVSKCAEEIYATMLYFFTVSTFESPLGLTPDLGVLKKLLCKDAAKIVTKYIKDQPQNTQKFIIDTVMNSLWKYECDGKDVKFKKNILKKVQQLVKC